MKVLMISLDKGLLGRGQLGDVVERHQIYGQFCERLDIIVFSPPGFTVNQLSEKVRVYPTNARAKWQYFFAAKKIGRKLFKENRYDLIVAQTPFLDGLAGVCLKKKFKSKLLIHFHGDFWANANWLKEEKINRFLLWLSKFTVKRATAVRVMSQGQREKLLQAGVDAEKIRVISTPVDLKKYEATETRADLTKEKIILHVGRDDQVKDYDTLVKTFKLVKEKYPAVKLWQAGASSYLKAAMAQNNFFADIEILGKKDQQDLIKIYQQSDIIVLTSTSESFGKVLVEANACAKPVVATQTTGAKEIIQDGVNGFLTPIGQPEILAQKILFLLNNPEPAKIMGENGKRMMAEKFGNNTQRIIDYWQAIIAGGRKKILMITRKVDENDALAGFTYNWVKKISQNLERLYVIGWQKSQRGNLPANVTIFSLPDNKLLKVFALFKLLIKILPQVDGVFCHMNPEYTILVGPWAKILGKKIVSWYTHKTISWRRRLMEFFADTIVTASEKSFRQPRYPQKVKVLGHGIDLEVFAPRPAEPRQTFKIISVGRISPTKEYGSIIEAINLLPDKNIALEIIGDAILAEQRGYLEELKEKAARLGLLNRQVFFRGWVANKDLAPYYQSADLFINLSGTGSLDKVVLEAMACGCLVLTANEAFDQILPADFMVKRHEPGLLAQKIGWLKNLAPNEVSRYRQEFRAIVVKDHNLEQLAQKIVSQFD